MITIRPVRKQDKKQFYILADEFLSVVAKHDPAFVSHRKAKSDHRRYLASYFTSKNKLILVAVDRASIVGFCTVRVDGMPGYFKHARRVVIESLYIDQKYRNRGLGKKLLNKAIEWARKQNTDFIEIETWASNQDARRLYQRTQFKTRFIGLSQKILWEKH